MAASLFENSAYQDLLDALEKSIYARIPASGPSIGRYREAVFYQIDHGQGHLRRVRANMETMLCCGKGKLDDMDVFVALAAAAFHDLGMHFGWYLVDPTIKEYPYSLFLVSLRLSRSEYAPASELQAWQERLQSSPALLEAFFLENPVGAAHLHRHVKIDFEFTGLVEKHEPAILIRLGNMTPHAVVMFLNYVGKKRGEVLVEGLLANDYQRVLGQSPPQFVVTFLSYVGKERGEEVVEGLLANDYQRVLFSAAINNCLPFFKALKTFDDESGTDLAQAVFENWLSSLLRSPLQKKMLNQFSGLFDLTYDVAPLLLKDIEVWLWENRETLRNWAVEASPENRLGLQNAMVRHNVSRGLVNFVKPW